MTETRSVEAALKVARQLFPGQKDDDPLDSLQIMELLAHLERNGFEPPSPSVIVEHTIAGVVGAERVPVSYAAPDHEILRALVDEEADDRQK